jgi:hypothetical protein
MCPRCSVEPARLIPRKRWGSTDARRVSHQVSWIPSVHGHARFGRRVRGSVGATRARAGGGDRICRRRRWRAAGCGRRCWSSLAWGTAHRKPCGGGKGVRYRFVQRQACLWALRTQATVVGYLQAPSVFRAQVTIDGASPKNRQRRRCPSSRLRTSTVPSVSVCKRRSLSWQPSSATGYGSCIQTSQSTSSTPKPPPCASSSTCSGLRRRGRTCLELAHQLTSDEYLEWQGFDRSARLVASTCMFSHGTVPPLFGFHQSSAGILEVQVVLQLL